jgi:hypothetical protein
MPLGPDTVGAMGPADIGTALYPSRPTCWARVRSIYYTKASDICYEGHSKIQNVLLYITSSSTKRPSTKRP